MKRRIFLSFIFCVNCALFYCCDGVEGSPTQNLHNNIAVTKFQNALQQQSFFSTLSSIEDRLRNLDNIYSMQLSQTLENKLDLYSRRLEALDAKIIRLEALVMLNLDKISENISTKNFKDDVTKTNMFRKMDSIYEGISNRLAYLDRKYENSFQKLQTKTDAVTTRLEKMDENMMTRNSDLEAELSDAVFAIDDLKSSCSSLEDKLLNITRSTFNITNDNYNFLRTTNIESRKAMNKLHDNIIESLKFIDNKTSTHLKVSENNNIILRNMKVELKDDFNDYANKVADMNSDIWKNSDTTEDDLRIIATLINGTKIEVQNGVRALMIQIGKITNKNNSLTTDFKGFGLEDINKKLNENFEKILSNQEIFLESCHRLQMDESQIETEISAMLEKLIDMLENKISSEVKDIKNLEKTLKNYENRINRNMYQVNNNVISLFEKSTVHDKETKNRLIKINGDLDTLKSFVQRSLADKMSTSHLQEISNKLNKLEHLINAFKIQLEQNLRNTSRIEDSQANNEINKELQMLSETLRAIESLINKQFNEENINMIFDKIFKKYFTQNCMNNTNKANISKQDIDPDIKKTIEDIFGKNPNSENENTTKIKICKKQFPDIDIRSGSDFNCEDNSKIKKTKKKKRKYKQKRPIDIDVRGNFNSTEYIEYDDEYNNDNNDTTENPDVLTDRTTETEDVTTEMTTNIPTDVTLTVLEDREDDIRNDT